MFFNKKSPLLGDKAASGSGNKNGNLLNKALAEELHKPIVREFGKRNVHLSFIDNISGSDLADVQLISKFNKRFRILLCIILNMHGVFL